MFEPCMGDDNRCSSNLSVCIVNSCCPTSICMPFALNHSCTDDQSMDTGSSNTTPALPTAPELGSQTSERPRTPILYSTMLTRLMSSTFGSRTSASVTSSVSGMRASAGPSSMPPATPSVPSPRASAGPTSILSATPSVSGSRAPTGPSSMRPATTSVSGSRASAGPSSMLPATSSVSGSRASGRPFSMPSETSSVSGSRASAGPSSMPPATTLISGSRASAGPSSIPSATSSVSGSRASAGQTSMPKATSLALGSRASAGQTSMPIATSSVSGSKASAGPSSLKLDTIMSPVASSMPPAVTSGGLLTSPTSATSMATVTPGCTWSAWDNGSCSVTCGTGVYSRHRVCLDANHGVCNTCGQNSTMTGTRPCFYPNCQ
ncbi:unnamed protein product [Adineta steineri]|uniref:Uncharacterized protein n=1 Tax=Adineta steineri TaxID=433720 RepID=A0A813W0G1_9BILA|nr:unnamed protein product [Adineta steineri]CAF1308212.1 unnamed protein product [Adineta steineri]CAF1309297.1 unnamed protein product [Adineta steineri]